MDISLTIYFAVIERKNKRKFILDNSRRRNLNETADTENS